MRLCLLIIVLIGFCFDINSGCCGKGNNDNSKGCCKCCGAGDDLGPGNGNKFDAEIKVGPDSVTIKPVGGKNIVLDGNHTVNKKGVVAKPYTYKGECKIYKFDYSKLIMNAKVTVDNEIKEKPYLIAIVSLKEKDSTKYLIIAYNENGNMSALFADGVVDVLILSSAGITNMADMFSLCKYLTTCNINIDTSKVTDMSNMFYGCSSLSSLPDISKWDTGNVVNMGSMFEGCLSLTSLPDISKWNTSNVTNMGDMFNGCLSLSSLPDISKWNTDKLTNMDNMFKGCKALEEIPDKFKSAH